MNTSGIGNAQLGALSGAGMAGQAAQNLKHNEIANAIKRLDEVVDRLDDLINDINGLDSIERVEGICGAIPLRDLLNTAAASINGKVDLAHEKIGEVRELLF